MLDDDTLYQRLERLDARLDSLAGRSGEGRGQPGPSLMNDPEFYNNLNGAAKDARAPHRGHPEGSEQVLAGQGEVF